MDIEMKGWFEMKKLTHVQFTYEDGTIDEIIDTRACAMFQSRINSNGLVSGMGEFILTRVPEESDVK